MSAENNLRMEGAFQLGIPDYDPIPDLDAPQVKKFVIRGFSPLTASKPMIWANNGLCQLFLSHQIDP